MNTSKQEFSIHDILKIIWKNVAVIVLLAVVGGGATGLYAKHKQKVTYTASRNILISHNLNDKKSSSRVNSDLDMMPTYAEIIEGRPITNETYELLSKKQQKKLSQDDISKAVSTNSRPQSLIVNIKATTGNAKSAIMIANKTAEATQQSLPKIQPGVGHIYLYPKANKKNVVVQQHSSIKKYTILGGALGALAGMVLAFVFTSWKHLL